MEVNKILYLYLMGKITKKQRENLLAEHGTEFKSMAKKNNRVNFYVVSNGKAKIISL